MKTKASNCVDRAFYSEHYPGAGFEEARALMIAQYVEKEIEPQLEKKLKVHIDQCSCCTQFLEELEGAGDFELTQDAIPYAVCPSDRLLDQYAFSPRELSSDDSKRIESHLKECPLCKEELDWLRSVEQQRVIEFTSRQSPKLMYLSVAAAIVFCLLSVVLLWQKYSTTPPHRQLQSLAHIKEPGEINYISLDQTSTVLSGQTDQIYEQAVNHFKQKDFRSASAEFETVLKASPQHSASLYLLGYCYYKMNQPEKAFALCDRAERIRPHTYERCMSLVNIALKTGHYGRAVREITALYHEVPEAPGVRDMYQKITSLTKGRTLKM